ncbi:MAG: hypothetical protein AAFX09_01730 [Pseudomonadota bacterium]
MMGLEPGRSQSWRAAVARSERVSILRGETRSLAEAGLLRVGGWLFVQGLLRSIRPLIFVLLLAVSGYFAFQGGVAAYQHSGWSPLPSAMAPTAPDPFANVLPEGEAGLSVWRNRIANAIVAPADGPPDLYLAEAYLAAAPRLLGEPRLAALAFPDAEFNDAAFRAAPAWRGYRPAENGFEQLMNAARERGYQPPMLIFVEEDARRWWSRGANLYGPLLDRVDGAIASGDPVDMQMGIAPGLRDTANPDARLRGDVEAVILAACARDALDGCPKLEAGARHDGLSLLLAAAALSERFDPLGARVLRAAHTAGSLNEDVQRSLFTGLNDAISIQSLEAQLGVRTISVGQGLLRPDAAALRVRRAVHDATRTDQGVDAESWLANVGAVARQIGPSNAARLIGSVQDVSQLEAWRGSVEREGLALLAYQDLGLPLAAPPALNASAGDQPVGPEASRAFAQAILALMAAFVLVLSAPFLSGAQSNLPGSGRGELFNARLSRLILGKKA